MHTLTNWDSDNVLQIYLNALTHAYDPHTDYLNEQRAADFSISMSLSLFGIGARLTEEDGYCTIDSLVPGGPADQSGQIKQKERIIAVGQSNLPPVNVVDMELPKVVELIRGPKDTTVRLTLDEKNRPSLRHDVTLTRKEIKLEDQEAKARLIELPDGHGGTNRIGVINVPSFYAPIGSANATQFHIRGHRHIDQETRGWNKSPASSWTCAAIPAARSRKPSSSPACSPRKARSFSLAITTGISR